MGACFLDLALVQHNYFAGLADSRKAMGDNNRCAAGDKRIDGVLYKLLTFSVYRGGGLVEYQHRGVVQQRADKGNKLPLAKAKGVTPLHYIVAVTAG